MRVSLDDCSAASDRSRGGSTGYILIDVVSLNVRACVRMSLLCDCVREAHSGAKPWRFEQIPTSGVRAVQLQDDEHPPRHEVCRVAYQAEVPCPLPPRLRLCGRPAHSFVTRRCWGRFQTIKATLEFRTSVEEV